MYNSETSNNKTTIDFVAIHSSIEFKVLYITSMLTFKVLNNIVPTSNIKLNKNETKYYVNTYAENSTKYVDDTRTK